MKNQYVEQRLKKELEEITPNVIDGALEKVQRRKPKR